MRFLLPIALILAGVFLLACASAPTPPAETTAAISAPPADAAAFDPAWARDPLWDDGQAEVALYDARRPQYGKIESYEALFIVVKEDFNTQFHVKADPPFENKPLLPVLKLNAVHSYWTDNYPYHFLASVFVRRDDPTAVVKLTVGSQEWCGNTFKEVKTWGGRTELVSHSYFDTEGDGSRPLDLRPGDLLEDQLPLALRGLAFAPGLETRRRILPSLISNNLRGPAEFQPATITVVGEEKVATGAGSFSAWRVNLKMGELEQTWWFEKDAPHGLLKMESSDGRAWLLKARSRKRYWREPTYHPET
ncbi:MAG TPA: hypothetical protein VJ085_10785 [Candidatus Acidoferrales bacterium]|nr:hypothetical protein [Candidatus Acidoferrales bacterium]